MTASIAGTAPVVASNSVDRVPAQSTVFTLDPPGLNARQRELVDRYHHLLTRPDTELRDGLARMIRAEQALPEADLHAAAHARLKTWLALDREDARIIARAFDEAMERCSKEQQERRFTAERAAIMNGLRFAEFRALCGIVPWLRSEESLQLLFPEIAPDDPDAPPDPLPTAA
jgi:hypothetical protein